MPTYDYACKSCGKRFEHFQSIKADVLTECPESVCDQEDPARKGHGEVTRLISKGAGFILTGEGFYETDYVRSKKDSKSGKSDSSAGNKDKSAASGGSSEQAKKPATGSSDSKS